MVLSNRYLDLFLEQVSLLGQVLNLSKGVPHRGGSYFPGLSQLPSEGSSCFDFCLGQDDLEDSSFLNVRFLKYYLSSYSDYLKEDFFFVFPMKSKEGDIAAQTISIWINILSFIPSNSVPHVKAPDVFAQVSFWSFRWFSTASRHERFLLECLHFTFFPLEMLY